MDAAKQRSGEGRKFDWNWFAISLAMYLIFYIAPLSLSVGITDYTSWIHGFFSTWLFAGVIIIAGITAYLSKGVTIWEPALAALLMMVIYTIGVYGVRSVMYGDKSYLVRYSVMDAFWPVIVVFLLAVFGGWLGEKIQAATVRKKPA
ncbi:MAG: hypothetical protein V3U10_01865 [Bacteroidota bacterium]